MGNAVQSLRMRLRKQNQTLHFIIENTYLFKKHSRSQTIKWHSTCNKQNSFFVLATKNKLCSTARRAYSSNVFRKRWYIADFGSSCSRGLGHFFFIFSNERRNRTPTTQVRPWHCTTETVGDALNSLDVGENKKDTTINSNTYEQYVYALTCETRCHQCILWMTRAHSYTRCGSFF